MIDDVSRHEVARQFLDYSAKTPQIRDAHCSYDKSSLAAHPFDGRDQAQEKNDAYYVAPSLAGSAHRSSHMRLLLLA